MTVYIVYTDYDTFSVEFVCVSNIGDVCTNPEVRFLTRSKKEISQENLVLAEQLIQDLCVDPEVYADVIQQESMFPITDLYCYSNSPIRSSLKLPDKMFTQTPRLVV